MQRVGCRTGRIDVYFCKARGRRKNLRIFLPNVNQFYQVMCRWRHEVEYSFSTPEMDGLTKRLRPSFRLNHYINNSNGNITSHTKHWHFKLCPLLITQAKSLHNDKNGHEMVEKEKKRRNNNETFIVRQFFALCTPLFIKEAHWRICES